RIGRPVSGSVSYGTTLNLVRGAGALDLPVRATATLPCTRGPLLTRACDALPAWGAAGAALAFFATAALLLAGAGAALATADFFGAGAGLAGAVFAAGAAAFFEVGLAAFFTGAGAAFAAGLRTTGAAFFAGAFFATTFVAAAFFTAGFTAAFFAGDFFAGAFFTALAAGFAALVVDLADFAGCAGFFADFLTAT